MTSSSFQLELENSADELSNVNPPSTEPVVVSISDDETDSECECLDPVQKQQRPKTALSISAEGSKNLRQQTLSGFFKSKLQSKPAALTARNAVANNKSQEQKSALSTQPASKKLANNRFGRRKTASSASASTSTARRKRSAANDTDGAVKEVKRKVKKPAPNENQEESSSSSAKPTKQTPLEDLPYCKRVPGTRFIVDAFSFGAVIGCNGYFLSHFHADHYWGLSGSFAHGTIYCSPITAALVKLCLRVNERYIKVINTDEWCTVEGTEVYAVDANHCPGSQMFAFRNPSDGRTHLHTGDFRGCRATDSPQFAGITAVLDRCKSIDTLFLDTTYLDPDFSFPDQSDVIATAIRLAKQAVRNETRTLFVVGSYKIGKERLFISLARALGTRIYAADKVKQSVLRIVFDDPLVRHFASVDHTDRKVKKTAPKKEHQEVPSSGDGSSTNPVDMQQLLTDDPFAAKVHVMSMMSVDYQTLRAYLHKMNGQFARICSFEGTGWSFTPRSGGRVHRPVTHSEYTETIRKPDVIGYSLPYSEHSSFSELEWFVKRIQPRRTVATVGSSESREAFESAYFLPWVAAAKGLSSRI